MIPPLRISIICCPVPDHARDFLRRRSACDSISDSIRPWVSLGMSFGTIDLEYDDLAFRSSAHTMDFARSGVGGSDAGIRTERVVLPCTVCRRAENCCKAEGLTDCNYTARCTSASLAEPMQFYLALCQTVLGASSARSKRPADVCGSH